MKLKYCWQFITGLCLKIRHKKNHVGYVNQSQNNWYFGVLVFNEQTPKAFSWVCCCFPMYFLISLHSSVTSVALGFPVAVLSTRIHTVHNLTQISVVFALQETHCVIFAVSTKADVEVTQYKHESRASSLLLLLYVHVFLFSKDKLFKSVSKDISHVTPYFYFK